MAMTRVSLTAFEDRQGRFIFVAIPNEIGRYLRTDRSVALFGCPMCGAQVGEPCFTSGGPLEPGKPIRYGASTHYVRRRSIRAYSREPVDDVVDVAFTALPTTDEMMEASS